jgi:hypothetical protein
MPVLSYGTTKTGRRSSMGEPLGAHRRVSLSCERRMIYPQARGTRPRILSYPCSSISVIAGTTPSDIES